MAGNVVTVTNMERLPNDTAFYLTDDGTVYYRKMKFPYRFYVKSHGKEIDVELLNGSLYFIEATEDAVYVGSNGKAYKIVYSHDDGFKIDFLRDRIEDQQFSYYSYSYSQMMVGKRYVFRMSDNSDGDGIQIDVSEEWLKNLKFAGTHRTKAIYLAQRFDKNQPSVCKLGENGIIIEAPYERQARVYARDSSRFIYICYRNEKVHVLDADLMTFLPPLQLEDVRRIYYVAGVCNGEITVHGEIGMTNDDYLLNAQLPIGYYESSTASIVDQEVVNTMQECINELQASEKRLTNEKEEIIQNHERKEKELANKMDELRMQLAALALEKEQMQKRNAELEKLTLK